jgi:hypothetical protein
MSTRLIWISVFAVLGACGGDDDTNPDGGAPGGRDGQALDAPRDAAAIDAPPGQPDAAAVDGARSGDGAPVDVATPIDGGGQTGDANPGGDALVSLPASPGIGGAWNLCGQDGWCWSYPSPPSVRLEMLWSGGPNDLWVAAPAFDHGVNAYHWNGATWTRKPLPRPVTRKDPNQMPVWGSSGNNVYVIDNGLLHWNGTAWVDVPPPTGDSSWGTGKRIWGTGPNDIYIYNGGAFSPDLSTVAPSTPSFKWDGISWTRWQNPPPITGYLHGSAPNRLIMVSARGEIARWNGTAWSLVDAGSHRLWSLAFVDENEFWAGSYDAARAIGRWRSGVWELIADQSAIDLGGNLQYFLHANNAGVWFARGALFPARLSVLHPTSPPQVDPQVLAGGDISIIADGAKGANESGLWVSNGGLHRIDSNTVVPRTVGWEFLPTLLWGSGDNDVWAPDGTRFVRFDGTEWRGVPRAGTSKVTAVWGANAQRIWFVGQGIVSWDGARLSDLETECLLSSVGGTSDRDVWAGKGGTTSNPSSPNAVAPCVYHFDGATWARYPVSNAVGELTGFKGIGEVVWAFSDRGLARWDRTAWTNIAGSPASIRAVVPVTATSVWVRAAGGDYLWDGAAWSRPATGAPPPTPTLPVWTAPGGRTWRIHDDTLGLRGIQYKP